MPISNETLVIGLGLMGGSFAKALKKYNVTQKISAFDLDEESIELAKKSGVIDKFSDIAEDISHFDLIILATPLASYKEIFKEIEHKISSNRVIIELGSVKEYVIKSCPKNLKNNIVFCHPIAGSQMTGFENADADLFLNKKFIICKENSDLKTLEKAEKIIDKIGGKIEFLEAKKHDEIYALVSHLPQFISFLTKEYSPKNIADEVLKKAFRLDDSGPEIWSDIFKFNEENLEEFYLEFFDNLEEFEKKIHEKKFEVIVKELKSRQHGFENVSIPEDIFPEIFFRIILVASYLKIKKINEYSSFAGQGFADFTSIINLEENDLLILLQKNQQKILKLIQGLS